MTERLCECCGRTRQNTRTAVVGGKYYRNICVSCIGGTTGLSSGSASFERRRGYEDNAQDTIQPYNAAGPNPEFLRLYPERAAKVFTKAEIEEMKRKI